MCYVFRNGLGFIGGKEMKMKEEPDSLVHVVIAGPAHIKYVYPILQEMPFAFVVLNMLF